MRVITKNRNEMNENQREKVLQLRYFLCYFFCLLLIFGIALLRVTYIHISTYNVSLRFCFLLSGLYMPFYTQNPQTHVKHPKA